MLDCKAGVVREPSAETTGAGAITEPRVIDRECASATFAGAGAITLEASAGAARVECNPSAEGGAGVDFIASRLATGWSDAGSFKFGASTTFSARELPRAT